MASKSNQKIEPGDEVKLRAIVTGVWANGQFTVQCGQRVTLPNESDVEESSRPSRCGRGSASG